MDLYKQMGKELRALFHDLFQPKQASAVRQKIERIVETASQIGGPLHKEAQQLQADVVQYLSNRNDRHLEAVLKKRALRLEQETREI